jgi:hypothetical protein
MKKSSIGGKQYLEIIYESLVRRATTLLVVLAFPVSLAQLWSDHGKSQVIYIISNHRDRVLIILREVSIKEET